MVARTSFSAAHGLLARRAMSATGTCSRTVTITLGVGALLLSVSGLAGVAACSTSDATLEAADASPDAGDAAHGDDASDAGAPEASSMATLTSLTRSTPSRCSMTSRSPGDARHTSVAIVCNS